MQRNTKIILSVIIGVFLLIMLAIGGVAWYVAQNAEGWLERGKEREAEGRTAGESMNSRGCVDRAVADYRKDRGPISVLSHRLWLKGCLQTAEADHSFCPEITADGAFGQVREILAAQTAFCESRGLGNDQNCQQLAEEAHAFCFNTASFKTSSI
jgi:hypothetical protein